MHALLVSSLHTAPGESYIKMCRKCVIFNKTIIGKISESFLPPTAGSLPLDPHLLVAEGLRLHTYIFSLNSFNCFHNKSF